METDILKKLTIIAVLASAFMMSMVLVGCQDNSVSLQTPYNIIFNANGGNVFPISVFTGANGKLSQLPIPARKAYTFDGWFTFDSTEVSTETVFNSDATIYARWIEILTYGGQTYSTIVINGKTWMAENLNYAGAEGNTGVCYDNDLINCVVYGRLYTWAEAMGISNTYDTNKYNGIDVNHQGICPFGWHLPADAEWKALIDYVGGSETAGTKLRSRAGWYDSGTNTDEYGFSALPGGILYSDGSFFDIGSRGSWWSAADRDSVSAWCQSILFLPFVNRSTFNKNGRLSVRCVMD